MAHPDEENPFLGAEKLYRDSSFESAVETATSSSSTFKTGDRERRSHQRWILALLSISLICNAVFLATYLLSTKFQKPGNSGSVAEPYSPANDVISYHIQPAHQYEEHMENPYIAEPGPVLDSAWHELMKGTTFKVSQAELERANATSIEYAEGGHIAALGVFHELHCLKRFKFWMHKDHYYPNLTAEQYDFQVEHLSIVTRFPQQVGWVADFAALDHCIDVLRQGAMCRPDFTMYTFAWDSPDDVKPRTVVGSEKKCVDWSALWDFVRSRAPERFMELIKFGRAVYCPYRAVDGGVLIVALMSISCSRLPVAGNDILAFDDCGEHSLQFGKVHGLR